jgi:hypothetical protein
LAFYRGKFVDGEYQGDRGGAVYTIKDEPRVLEFFARAWGATASEPLAEESCERLTRDALAHEDFWGCSLSERLPDFTRDVAQHLHAICSVGIRSALQRLLADLGVDPMVDRDSRARG